MSENVMTVTRALSELKLLDKKINRRIYNSQFITNSVGGKLLNDKSIEEFSKKSKENLQSAQDLIKRRNLIKSLIVKSNAETKVTISGVEYTVAEAIERKCSIQYEEELLAKLKSQYSNVLRETDKINRDTKQRLDKSIEAMFGSESEKDEEFINSYTENFNKANGAEIVDPIKISETIEDLETSIENFISEVDHTLSVSNALTTIEL